MSNKISKEIREAIQQVVGDKMLINMVCNSAEEILNKPKLSPLQEKVRDIWSTLGYEQPHPQVTALIKALEGVVELPERVTNGMVSDYFNDYSSSRDSLQKIFNNIRAGKYD